MVIPVTIAEHRDVLLPQNQALGFLRDRNFWGKGQSFLPVHHFLICLLWSLGAEWWVACNEQEVCVLYSPEHGLSLPQAALSMVPCLTAT